MCRRRRITSSSPRVKARGRLVGCAVCGAVVAGASRLTVFHPRLASVSSVTAMVSKSKRIEEFLEARCYTREEVLSKSRPVPQAPGVYGWWFKKLPADIDTQECKKREGLTLLYTGISPKETPKNGARASTQNLRKRIRTHYAGNAAGSTLRLSLGCLLYKELGIELRRYGSMEKRRHFGKGEPYLSGWMHDNALVSWIEDDQPWILEKELIAELDLPLNCDQNQRNDFHETLTNRRRELAACADDRKKLPNPGIGGAKVAYR